MNSKPVDPGVMASGGEAIADSLIANGVDTVFGIPGIQLDALYDAFYKRRDRIRVIHTRHEQGAAYMAMGYAQASERTGVFAVVPGPGLLNSLTALADAASANLPVLGITGQIPSERIGQGLGFPHELKDQRAVVRGIIDWAERADHPSEVPARIDAAFRHMHHPRRRPAVFEMPPDLMAQRAPVVALPAASANFPRPPLADPDAVARAAARIAAAAAPLIMVGGGAMAAEAAVTRLAALLGAPVVMTSNGRGVLPDDHPLAFNMLCGQELWKSADLVIAVGTRMITPLLSWGRADLPVIRIDVDPVQALKPQHPAEAIVADAGDAVHALCDVLEAGRASPTRWNFAAITAPVMSRLAGLEPVAGYARAIRDAVPRDGIFVSDITQFGVYARFALPIYHPKTYLLPGYQATLGWAYPAALGAQVAHPERKVVTFAGDGGFLFNIQELATAVQHRIPVVAIVFNNSRFGNVHLIQAKDYGGRHIATDLANPDFVRLAQAFGMSAARVETPDGLAQALGAFLAAGAPALIEVTVGDLPDMWQLVKKPASQGDRRTHGPVVSRSI
jgi:acetolactate synthase I/II/III large subunit